MEPTPSPEYYYESDSRTFFRRRHNMTIGLALGLLLFLMPFAELRCGNFPIVRSSGLGLAIGASWRPSMGPRMNNSKERPKDDKTADMQKKLAAGPNIFALVALLAAITGLVFCLGSGKARSMVALSTGALAALMLIAMMIQMQISFSNAMKKAGDIASKSKDEFRQWGSSMTDMLKLHFTLWYYISLVSFICAAFLAYKHHRIELEDAIRASRDFEFDKGGEVSR